ncbi:MAG: alanine/ornithine racemase family PLP-dependent enzyme [Sedimenticola sp.]
METPYLTIDLEKIEHNSRTIVSLCRQSGIGVYGVTKATCGHPQVAEAMLRGGVDGIADSRFENIRRMQEAGIESDYLLLRIPPLSAVDEVVRLVDRSLNSELSVLAALSTAAARAGRTHEVILMVDLGDLREGVWPDQLIPLARETQKLPALRIAGIGSNLACFGGVDPSSENMGRLVTLAGEVERACGITLETITAINSSGLDLLQQGEMPQRINQARIGEGILLGRETIKRNPWPNTHQDAFLLHAEILELKRKPTQPTGRQGEDAFGGRPKFSDRGVRLRALLNVGREDVDVAGITPLDLGLQVIGASSGYLVVDVTDSATDCRVGDRLTFSLNYSALLTVMTSEYVKKMALTGAGLAVG